MGKKNPLLVSTGRKEVEVPMTHMALMKELKIWEISGRKEVLGMLGEKGSTTAHHHLPQVSGGLMLEEVWAKIMKKKVAPRSRQVVMKRIITSTFSKNKGSDVPCPSCVGVVATPRHSLTECPAMEDDRGDACNYNSVTRSRLEMGASEKRPSCCQTSAMRPGGSWKECSRKVPTRAGHSRGGCV